MSDSASCGPQGQILVPSQGAQSEFKQSWQRGKESVHTFVVFRWIAEQMAGVFAT